MILQLMIRRPDEELEQSILVGLQQSEENCVKSTVSLFNNQLTPEIAKLCFKFLPEGFIIEGVAYGTIDEEPKEAHDLFIKVLH